MTSPTLTRSITVRVHGIPKGQPRHRAFAFKGKVRCYDPGTAEAWKSAIADALRRYICECPLSGPLRLEIEHVMPRPKGHYRAGSHSASLRGDAPLFHTGTPDIDNLVKAAMDAMTQIGVWRDDAQVCEIAATKTYGAVPGATITVNQIEAPAEDQPGHGIIQALCDALGYKKGENENAHC